MIISNQVQCHNCGEAPWSAHRHDFVWCGCDLESERVAVDGGMEYLMRAYGDKANFRDISITVSDEHVEGLRDAITDPERNELGRVCNLARYLRDEMGINISTKEDT